MPDRQSGRSQKLTALGALFFFIAAQMSNSSLLNAQPSAPADELKAQTVAPEKAYDESANAHPQTVHSKRSSGQTGLVLPSTSFLADDTALTQSASDETDADTGTQTATAPATKTQIAVETAVHSAVATATDASIRSVTQTASSTATKTQTAVETAAQSEIATATATAQQTETNLETNIKTNTIGTSAINAVVARALVDVYAQAAMAAGSTSVSARQLVVLKTEAIPSFPERPQYRIQYQDVSGTWYATATGQLTANGFKYEIKMIDNPFLHLDTEVDTLRTQMAHDAQMLIQQNENALKQLQLNLLTASDRLSALVKALDENLDQEKGILQQVVDSLKGLMGPEFSVSQNTRQEIEQYLKAVAAFRADGQADGLYALRSRYIEALENATTAQIKFDIAGGQKYLVALHDWMSSLQNAQTTAELQLINSSRPKQERVIISSIRPESFNPLVAVLKLRMQGDDLLRKTKDEMIKNQLTRKQMLDYIHSAMAAYQDALRSVNRRPLPGLPFTAPAVHADELRLMIQAMNLSPEMAQRLNFFQMYETDMTQGLAGSNRSTGQQREAYLKFLEQEGLSWKLPVVSVPSSFARISTIRKVYEDLQNIFQGEDPQAYYRARVVDITEKISTNVSKIHEQFLVLKEFGRYTRSFSNFTAQARSAYQALTGHEAPLNSAELERWINASGLSGQEAEHVRHIYEYEKWVHGSADAIMRGVEYEGWGNMDAFNALAAKEQLPSFPVMALIQLKSLDMNNMTAVKAAVDEMKKLFGPDPEKKFEQDLIALKASIQAALMAIQKIDRELLALKDKTHVPYPVQRYVDQIKQAVGDGFTVSVTVVKTLPAQYAVTITDSKIYVKQPTSGFHAMTVTLGTPNRYGQLSVVSINARYYGSKADIAFNGLMLFQALHQLPDAAADLSAMGVMTKLSVQSVETNGTVHFTLNQLNYKAYRNAAGKVILEKEKTKITDPAGTHGVITRLNTDPAIRVTLLAGKYTTNAPVSEIRRYENGVLKELRYEISFPWVDPYMNGSIVRTMRVEVIDGKSTGKMLSLEEHWQY